ncbi:MAG: glycosyltransferase family 39 protein [Tepidisphaeraceae bacterium]
MNESIAPIDDAQHRDRLVTFLRAAVVIGIVARLVQYLWRRSYWHDESYLVLNVTSLTYRRLVGPLPHAQSAPPVFLIAQKALFDALGQSEFVLRLIPLLLGCAAVVLMAILARRCVGTIGAVCAVTLFALSDRLIWHAAEAKQYSGDVFFALLLLLAATNPREPQTRRLLIASLIAAAALWVSHPVVFVFGGIALALLLSFLRRGARGTTTFALCCLPALLSFVVLYSVSIRHQEQGTLFAYWAEDFPDWSRAWTIPLWLLDRPLELGRYSYEHGGEVVAILAIVGAWRLWRDGQRQLLGILLAPAGLTLLAAFVHRYPFGGSRVTVFLIPAVILLAGNGIEWICRAASETKWQPLARGFVVVVLAIGVAQAAYHLLVPRHRGHIRPAVEYVRAHRQPGEPVYVLGEINPFLCYWREPDLPVQTTPEDALKIADERFWIVYADGNQRDAVRRASLMKRVSGTSGRIQDSFGVPGGAAFLFDRNATSPASPATRP